MRTFFNKMFHTPTHDEYLNHLAGRTEGATSPIGDRETQLASAATKKPVFNFVVSSVDSSIRGIVNATLALLAYTLISHSLRPTITGSQLDVCSALSNYILKFGPIAHGTKQSFFESCVSKIALNIDCHRLNSEDLLEARTSNLILGAFDTLYENPIIITCATLAYIFMKAKSNIRNCEKAEKTAETQLVRGLKAKYLEITDSLERKKDADLAQEILVRKRKIKKEIKDLGLDIVDVTKITKPLLKAAEKISESMSRS